MKILIDAFYLEKQYSSMGIFQKNLIENMLRIDHSDEIHIVTSNNATVDFEFENCFVHKFTDALISRNFYLKKLINKLNLDVFFSTFNLFPPMMERVKITKILQNHDWSHSQFPETIKDNVKGSIYAEMHKRSAKNASVNISNSNFTRKETKKYSGMDSVVIYHDADPVYKEQEGLHNSGDFAFPVIPGQYIIYAGRVFPKYKNISTLIAAFNNIHSEYSRIKLVIVHSDSFRKEDEAMINEIGSDIVSLIDIKKSDLKFLYMNSICMVYPSIYEGFGSPILEAQNSGTPVIVYKKEPMTEVGGEGAVYFHGTVKDLTNSIKLFIEDSLYRKNIINKGYKNAARFSWEETARKTLEIIKNELE